MCNFFCGAETRKLQKPENSGLLKTLTTIFIWFVENNKWFLNIFWRNIFLKTPYFCNKLRGGEEEGEDHSTSSYCTHKPLYCTNKPLFHHISYSPSLMILDFGPLERSSTDVATAASDYILNNSHF